ncbi:MAG: histidine kinase [Prosthecobacter sp.]
MVNLPSHCRVMLLMAVVVLSGCGREARVPRAGKMGGASFRFGNEAALAMAQRSGGWREVRLDAGWRAQGLPGSRWVGRQGWYRWEITLPEEPVEGGLMLSAGFIGNNSEVWFNGVRVGGMGSFDRLDGTRPRTVHAFPVASSLLRWGKVNVVAVRVRAVVGDGGILGGPVGLFPLDELMREMRRLEGQRDWMKLLVAAVGLCFALMCAVTWLAGERSVPWLHAALLLALGAGAELMTSALAGVSGIDADVDGARRVWLVMVGLQPVLTLYATRRLCRQGAGVFDWVTLGLAAVAFGCLALPATLEWLGVVVFGIYVTAAGTGCLWHIVRAWRRGVATARPLAWAYAVMVLAVTLQMSLVVLPWLPVAALWWEPLDWGWLLHAGVLAVALVRESVRSRVREKALAERLLQAGVEERARIGRHLHDYLVQDLEYLHLRAQAAALEHRDPPTFHGEVDAVTKRVIQSARRMAEDLQPLALRGVGLPTALRELAKLLKERHGATVEVRVEEPLADLSKQEAEVLYRAAHEAAGNAAQHAEAARVTITLSADATRAVVEVADDGVGFDLEEAVNHGRLGLRFLHDHAEASGARLKITSKRGEGATMRFTLPRHPPTK